MIEVTERAIQYLEEFLSTEPGKVIRFEISSGGCNGFSKSLAIGETRDDDIIVDLGRVILVMDDITASMAGSARIDWIDGLTGSFFEIHIPGASSSCGCGTSFSL